jgi:hypothetical protein
VSAGRVRHWKHGWIPLDAYAREIAAGKRQGGVSQVPQKPLHRRDAAKLTPPGDALARARERQRAYFAQRDRESQGINTTTAGQWRLTTVDGYPEVYFKELRDFETQSPERYREVAEDVTSVTRKFPKLTADNNPLQIAIVPQSELGDPRTLADTGQLLPHRLRISQDMWDRPGLTMAAMLSMRENHFGITANADDMEEFRRNVITHELGHVIHMRDEDDNMSALARTRPELRLAMLHGEIDKFANEKITPREAGFTDLIPASEGSGLDRPVPRWQVDSLDHQSAYATQDPYEFFAEAFTDGMINGSAATASGKRALALAQQIFGGTK